MKNIIVKLVRNGLLTVSALLLAQAAFGATATITVSGTVNASAQITATPAPGLSDAELNNGVTDKAMSTVNEKCNKNAGYTVTIESLNAKNAPSTQARMNGTGGNTDVVNYTIKYATVSVTLDGTGKATVTDVTTKTGGSGVDKALTISIPAAQNPAADTYTDTLTLTIAVK